RIITDKRFANKLLIGGLISFVPILNIVILGYFQGYARQIRDSGNLSLPSLDKWWIRLGTLFLDGLLLLALLAAYSLAGGDSSRVSATISVRRISRGPLFRNSTNSIALSAGRRILIKHCGTFTTAFSAHQG
ncbi:MAG: hypothetical protein IID45_03040, partial [Planctomycetes bacterium]|nr:hypothetical protein [Planctomycetota bacterium]